MFLEGKNATDYTSYFVKKSVQWCYFWNQHPKIRKKEVSNFKFIKATLFILTMIFSTDGD